MSARLLPLAAVGLVALVAVAAATAFPSAPDARGGVAAAIATELRCPDCQALSVADSPTQSAAEIRRQIAELLAAGETPDEVRAHFVDRYGEWILLAPRAPWIWAIPFGILALGAFVLVVWLRRGSHVATDQTPGNSQGPDAPGDAQRSRVWDEVEALDG